MEGEVECGVGWCRRCSHCGAGELMPGGVTERKHVVSHNKLEGIDEGCDWDLGEEESVSTEVVGDAFQGFVGIYVGVHRYRVGCDEGDFSLQL